MPDPKHSPLPWKESGGSIVDYNGFKLLGQFGIVKNESDAALIAQAVNSHAHHLQVIKELREALERIAQAHYDCLAPTQCRKKNRLCVPCITKDALALARNEKPSGGEVAK